MAGKDQLRFTKSLPTLQQRAVRQCTRHRSYPFGLLPSSIWVQSPKRAASSSSGLAAAATYHYGRKFKICPIINYYMTLLYPKSAKFSFEYKKLLLRQQFLSFSTEELLLVIIYDIYNERRPNNIWKKLQIPAIVIHTYQQCYHSLTDQLPPTISTVDNLTGVLISEPDENEILKILQKKIVHQSSVTSYNYWLLIIKPTFTLLLCSIY